MDLLRCHGSILIYIFVVWFCFTLVCLDLSFDFFGIGLCCFELVYGCVSYGFAFCISFLVHWL